MPVPKGKHIDVLEAFAKGFELEGKNDAYLELGVAGGRCFKKIAPHFKHSVGVEQDGQQCNEFYKDNTSSDYSLINTTTDDFFYFHCNMSKFNLIFIDADHDFISVQKDFNNSILHLDINGLIVLHDTYPQSVAWTKACKDAYKIRYVINSNKDYYFVTLPFCSGLTVVSLNR